MEVKRKWLFLLKNSWRFCLKCRIQNHHFKRRSAEASDEAKSEKTMLRVCGEWNIKQEDSRFEGSGSETCVSLWQCIKFNECCHFLGVCYYLWQTTFVTVLIRQLFVNAHNLWCAFVWLPLKRADKVWMCEMEKTKWEQQSK